MQWIDCPGQGCCRGLLSSGLGCSSTTAQTYWTCPCTLGWGCGGVCCFPLSLHSVFWVIFFKFFWFSYWGSIKPPPLLTHGGTRIALVHFQHLHNLALLQKEILSCTLCSCPIQLPVPVCVCAAVGICVTALGLGLGAWPCWGLKKASVKLSQVEKSSICQDSWLFLPCWNCSLQMLHQHSRIITSV